MLGGRDPGSLIRRRSPKKDGQPDEAPGAADRKVRGFCVLQTKPSLLGSTSVSRRASHSCASVVRHSSVAFVITDSKSGETFREHLVKRIG